MKKTDNISGGSELDTSTIKNYFVNLICVFMSVIILKGQVASQPTTVTMEDCLTITQVINIKT